jgi:nucleotide-binding universal stress UspA family protein
MLPFKKILWPTDFSEASFKALEAVKEIASKFSGAIWALHVVQPFPAFSAELTVSLPAFEQELIAASRSSLDKALQERGGAELAIHPVIKLGKPAEEIVRFATEEHIDLIIIATHGESAFNHFIFGSVAEKVIRLATCPVLVIRVAAAKAAQPVIQQ